MGLADPSCDLPKVVKVKPTRVHAAIPHGTSNADLGNIPRTNNNLRTVAWPQTLFMNYIRALCKTVHKIGLPIAEVMHARSGAQPT
jgi:hypothetical protein